jgi:hypothetical protein
MRFDLSCATVRACVQLLLCTCERYPSPTQQIKRLNASVEVGLHVAQEGHWNLELGTWNRTTSCPEELVTGGRVKVGNN